MNGRTHQAPGPAPHTPIAAVSSASVKGDRSTSRQGILRVAGENGWTDFLFSLLAFTMLFSRQIGAWGTEWNRFSAHWERENALALTLLIVLPALAAWWIGLLLRRRGARRLYRVWQGLLLLVLLTGLISLIPGSHQLPNAARYVVWSLISSVIVIPFLAPRVFRLIRSVALLFTVLPPILLIQAFLWPPVGTPDEEPVVTRGSATAGPTVILLVYDEWAYLRAARDGRFRPCLPQLRKLCRDAVFFSNAQSAGVWTLDSIPRLLYQTGAGFLVHNHQACFGKGRQTTPASDRESLFDQARAAGYATAVVGFYLPYRFILGDTVDYCCSHHYATNSPDLTGRMRFHLTENLGHLPDPLSVRLAGLTVHRFHDHHMRRITEAIHQRGLEVVAGCPEQSLVFIHEVGGHPPFIRLADGSFRPERVRAKPVHYEEQIRSIDGSVGDYVSALRRSERFDETLLIITSDHAWRHDPAKRVRAVKDWPSRVPLVVKWPGQQTPVRVDTPFSHLQLGRLIDLALTGGTLEEALALVSDPREASFTASRSRFGTGPSLAAAAVRDDTVPESGAGIGHPISAQARVGIRP